MESSGKNMIRSHAPTFVLRGEMHELFRLVPRRAPR